jgi:hypothetical protein
MSYKVFTLADLRALVALTLAQPTVKGIALISLPRSPTLSCATHNRRCAMNRYTNGVLTVIAIALVALVIENGITEVRAQPKPTTSHIAICDPTDSGNCVRVSYGKLFIGQ